MEKNLTIHLNTGMAEKEARLTDSFNIFLETGLCWAYARPEGERDSMVSDSMELTDWQCL